MAAAILSNKEQTTSIRAKAQKEGKGKNEKGTKPKVKNVLMPLTQKSILKLEHDVEDNISTKLKECLAKFSVPKKISKKQTDEEKEAIIDRKKLLRSQIVFGVNNVTKSLEKDLLRLVLTCSTADPPILTKHLVELATTRNCVAICMNNLNDILMNIVSFRSVAIGFLKPTENMANDFGDFVQSVNSVAPKFWQDGNESTGILVSQNKDPDSEVKVRSTTEKAETSNLENIKTETTNSEKHKSMETIEKEDSDICDENESNNLENLADSKQESEPEDFSRFYVFKKDLPASSLVPDFIPFMSDSDAESEEEVHVETKRPRLIKELEEYKSVNVGKMRHNENKNKSKKKKLKKKSRN